MSLLLAALAVSCGTRHRLPEASGGRLDLSSWVPERDGPVRLDGEWRFRWGTLVEPADRAGVAALDGYARVPSVWTNADSDGVTRPARGFATYYLHVTLPSAHPTLAVRLRDMCTAYRLYANGRLIAEAGVVGEDAASSEPEYRSRVGIIDAGAADRLELVLHVSNFDYAKGGPWETIRLGDARAIRRLREAAVLFESFLAGAMVIMALYHLSLFALRRQDRSPLFFAGACLAMVGRVFTTGDRALGDLLPGVPWEWSVRVEFLSMLLTTMLLTSFGHGLFEREIPRRMVRVVWAIGALFCALVLVADASTHSRLLIAMQAYVGGVALYGAAAVIVAAQRGREGAATFALGFGLLALTVVHDIAVSVGLLDTPAYMAPVGIFVFTFLQAVVLSRRLSHSLVRLEQVREDLVTAHARLDQHSKALEVRVAERSTQLAEANRELERLASIDGLTSIGNRRFFDAALRRSWADHARRGAPLSVAMCDIDHFKQFNDRYGHLRGDEALRSVARTLTDVVKRPLDVVARYGGEEFVVVLADSDAAAAREVAERIRGAVAAVAIEHASAPSGRLTISIGVSSVTPQPGTEPSGLVSRADGALYVAKESGRNRVSLADTGAEA